MSIDITTLALAKEYTNRMVGSGGTGGGVNGKDGITPHIGDNGNWFIGTVDTGISAQGPAGENGVTPHIGTNGNWYIGSVNTGVSAKGAKGDNGLDGNGIKSAILNSDYTLTLTFDDGTTYTTPSIRGATGSSGKDGPAGAAGKDGTDGVGIASIEQTATSTADGGNNVFTVTLTNGTTATFTVKNGSKGSTGKDGSNGVDGGHYTPVVTQPTTDTMQISFAPSKPDMPAVNTVTVNLPVSENSGQNMAQDYFLLKSPSGTAYKVTVTDGGALQVVGVADSSPDDLIPGRLLVWCDDFDGDTIDPEKWMFRLDNEKYYGAEDVQVSDSVLTYPITYDAANDRWRNFYMMTSGLEDVKYGRVEARMKWDLGAFTAWWTVGQVQEKYKGSTRGIIWPRSGEIDIFEDEGDGKLDVGLHWGEIEDAGLNQSNDIRRVGEGIDVTQWHNYAMEWDESSVVIYVDNVEMTRYDISNIAYEDGTRPFNLPHYFILSAWCKNPESGKDYYCYVDWVRYYAPAGITAEIPIQSMSLEQTAVALNKNRVRELALTISPDYCTDYTMRWDSSDRSIATFDGGRVKALSNGVCELTVTAKNGVVARCDLTVSDSVLNNAADIVLEYGEKDTYYAGDTITITPVVTPKWATYLDCNWTSSNEVATVANGVVTFVGGGEVTITATAKDNSGISRSVTFTAIAEITDNISTDGIVAKYTRKGWADGAWASDLEGGAALDTDQYAQGEGYWFRSFLSSENSYVAANLDTSGAFTIAERVLTKAGMKLGGYIWQIADSQSDGKTNPLMHASLDYNGKCIVRYTNTSGSNIVNNATVYQPLLNNISDELIVADMPLNLVFTHAADGTWATYANGALVANGTDGVAAETIPNAVLCLGAFPGVNRQKGESFKFQALLAYNKAMSAGEVTALNTALDEMYA